MILVSRLVGCFVLGVAGFQLGDQLRRPDGTPQWLDTALDLGLLAIVGAILGIFLGGIAGRWIVRKVPHATHRTADRSGGELVVRAVALLVGLGISALLSIPLMQLDPIGPYILLPLTLVIAYVAAEIGGARHADILALFGVRSASRESTDKRPVKLVLDTSAIIDGRIADVARTGFVLSTMIVPVFVLEELQNIADSTDPQRRARGRRGLDVVTAMRKARMLETTDEQPDADDVDAQLIHVARSHGWALVTTDYALNRVATAQDIQVLNVNELANALKPAFMAGDDVTVKLVREGKEAGQGVGYLDDGTMVVIDDGAVNIGESVTAQVTSVLQTPSGKLVFARQSRSDDQEHV